MGGSKYYGHYKMTHPPPPPLPNCRIQDVTSLALFVHLSGLIHKTLWLVKEAVVVVVGGGQNIMAIIK